MVEHDLINPTTQIDFLLKECLKKLENLDSQLNFYRNQFSKCRMMKLLKIKFNKIKYLINSIFNKIL